MQTTDRPRDRYDEEVERLTEEYAHYKAATIVRAWGYGEYHSPLFDACGKMRTQGNVAPKCGCPTQIRSGLRVAETDELTAEIRNDERLPFYSSLICPEHLPIFAEWQRKIDLALGRTPPAMLEQ